MNSEVKKLPKSEILITVSVPSEKFAQFEEQAAKLVSEKIEIPGFRKGQAPKAFIISHIGPDAFFEETLKVALPVSYFEAVRENDLKVISRPDVKITSKSPLKFEARTAVMPEISVKGFEKIKIPAKDNAITEAEMEEVIEEMRRYYATYKPAVRPIQKGDRIEIDFHGIDDSGVIIEKTKSANHPLFLGEGSLVPGFEENLAGMKLGEKKMFPVTFPKDYHHEPLRGKTIKFEASLKKAEEVILPEVNEEFVGRVMGEKKPVIQFREALKKDLSVKKAQQQRQERENELLEKLLAAGRLEIPPILVEEEIDFMFEDLKREISARGMDFKTYMEKLEKEKRDIRAEYSPEAEKRIRVRLIINHLYTALNISVSDAEMTDAQTRLIASVREEDRAKVKTDLERKGEVFMKLKNNLLLEKLFAHFLD